MGELTLQRIPLFSTQVDTKLKFSCKYHFILMVQNAYGG